MKVAIVHEWFSSYAGSEKVVEQILRCYPDADIFAVCDFLKPKEKHFLNNKKSLQHLFSVCHLQQKIPVLSAVDAVGYRTA